ncbi:hypothetical protein AB4144_17660, partial [Rhizobiaceae sp. 2RAB30]
MPSFPQMRRSPAAAASGAAQDVTPVQPEVKRGKSKPAATFARRRDMRRLFPGILVERMPHDQRHLAQR